MKHNSKNKAIRLKMLVGITILLRFVKRNKVFKYNKKLYSFVSDGNVIEAGGITFAQGGIPFVADGRCFAQGGRPFVADGNSAGAGGRGFAAGGYTAVIVLNGGGAAGRIKVWCSSSSQRFIAASAKNTAAMNDYLGISK